MPALLTSTSRRPQRVRPSSATRRSRSSGSEQVGRRRRRRPSSSAASASRRSARRAATTTRAPTASSTRAKRSPSPDEAPVTTATLPSRRNRPSGSSASSSWRRSVRSRAGSAIFTAVRADERADELADARWRPPVGRTSPHHEDDPAPAPPRAAAGAARPTSRPIDAPPRPRASASSPPSPRSCVEPSLTDVPTVAHPRPGRRRRLRPQLARQPGAADQRAATLILPSACTMDDAAMKVRIGVGLGHADHARTARSSGRSSTPSSGCASTACGCPSGSAARRPTRSWRWRTPPGARPG